MIHFIRICLFLFFFVGAFSPAYAETNLSAMRIGEHPDKTRLVLDLSHLSDFRSFVLESPYRIVVDVPNMNWTERALLPAAGAIQNVRIAPFRADMTRLVLELDQPHLVKSAFMMPASADKPARLVIDFNAVSKDAFQKGKAINHGTLPPPNVTPTKTTLPAPDLPLASRKPTFKALTGNSIPIPSHKLNTERPLIMIDAGHGGVDSGAVNGSILEKDITLKMAFTLQKHLEKTGRYRVQLTRSSDIYLKLHQRVNLARRADADLFISIHADSIRKSNVRGASVYTLSNKASDAQTARLAARENKSDTIAGIDLSIEDQDVADILIDLSMRETMNQSKYFANAVVDGMKDNRIHMLQNPHRYAGFAVLKAPDIPSVLIEIGFVSNKKEVQKLLRQDHQDRLATGIIRGIDRYFDTLTRNANAQ